jgi:hypothetical protein
VREGQFGDTPLSGVRFAQIASWPGPVHEGNGTRVFVLDEKTTPDQRQARLELYSGKHGGTYFAPPLKPPSASADCVFR